MLSEPTDPQRMTLTSMLSEPTDPQRMTYSHCLHTAGESEQLRQEAVCGLQLSFCPPELFFSMSTSIDFLGQLKET